MAPKKDFSTVNTNPVYQTIADAVGETEAAGTKRKYKSRKTYTEKEAAEALENLQTAGKKGVKLPRINLAFTPANYEFIKIMAQVRGQNLTEFVNYMLREARENHADVYNRAIEFRNSL
jgi:hypothetical protein